MIGPPPTAVVSAGVCLHLAFFPAMLWPSQVHAVLLQAKGVLAWCFCPCECHSSLLLGEFAAFGRADRLPGAALGTAAVPDAEGWRAPGFHPPGSSATCQA